MSNKDFFNMNKNNNSKENLKGIKSIKSINSQNKERECHQILKDGMKKIEKRLNSRDGKKLLYKNK